MDYSQIATLALYWAAGTLVHLAKKMGRDKITVRQYFMSKPLFTLASSCVSIAVCIGLYKAGDTGFVSYFGASYVAENLINQFDAPPQNESEDGTTETASS